MPIASPPRKEEDYRELAQKCVEIARTIPNEKMRVSLHNMAQAWLRLAEGQDDED
jgi:hypothetical protein